MKTPFSFCLIALAGALMLSGCATPGSVAKLQGQGVHHDFDMGYEPVWEAVRTITVLDDWYDLTEDEKMGLLTGRRRMAEMTFGDSLAIWVRRISPVKTQVEVVSRRAGPPVPFAPDHQRELLKKIEFVLIASR